MSLKLVVLDVDGILCDGKIYDSKHKVTGKVFNDLDFTAIKCFKCLGIPVVLLTSDDFNYKMSLDRHVEFFNGRDSISKKINKLKVYEAIKSGYGIDDDSEVCYIGDDRFDIPVLAKVGYAFCPSNSPNVVKTTDNVAGGIVVLEGRSGQNLVSEMFDWFVRYGILEEPSLDALQEKDARE